MRFWVRNDFFEAETSFGVILGIIFLKERPVFRGFYKKNLINEAKTLDRQGGGVIQYSVGRKI